MILRAAWNSQKYKKPVDSEVLTSFIPLHVHVLTVTTGHWCLHSRDATISRFLLFLISPRAVWMSLPNSLNCSHTVTTPRGWSDFAWTTSLCTFHVGLWDWSEKGDVTHYWFSDCLVSHIHHTPDMSLFFVLFCFFSFKSLLKTDGDDVFRTVGCFLFACWSCSHFSTSWKANCSEVDACS